MLNGRTHPCNLIHAICLGISPILLEALHGGRDFTISAVRFFIDATTNCEGDGGCL